MQKTAAGMASASGPRAEPIQPLNLFQFDDRVWTRCGQQLQEFWTSAEMHLKASMQCLHAETCMQIVLLWNSEQKKLKFTATQVAIEYLSTDGLCGCFIEFFSC